jgi:hypothetical protein
MKRNFLVGSVLCAAVTVGAAAQSSAPSGQTSDQKQNTRNQPMTLTGCLQAAGSAATAGTSGSATKAPSTADNFILANATAGAIGGTTTAGAIGGTTTAGAMAPPGSRPVASTGTNPSATAAGSPSASTADAAQYKLSGGDKDQLRRYVDSKVEITGKIEGPAEARTAPAGASSGAASTGPRTPETKTGQTLHIDSVHQLAPNCSM